MNAFFGIIYWNDYKERRYKGSSSKLISLGHSVEPNYLVHPNYAMLAVKNNPKSIIINWNETSKDYSPQLVTKKTIELERSVKSIKNEAVVLIITPCRDQVAVIESNVNNIERLCKIGKPNVTKCTGQNLLKHNYTLEIMKCTWALLTLPKF